MAVTKNPIAPDSAAELNGLIGDDATATFENDPKFIDSDPTGTASSENLQVQRDTDDTEDSDEEEDELEDEDDEDLDDDEEEDETDDDEDEDVDDEDDEDEDEDDLDDEREVGASADRSNQAMEMNGAVRDDDSSVEEDDDEDVEGLGGEDTGSDSPATDRAIDAALRMSALVALTSEFAANV